METSRKQLWPRAAANFSVFSPTSVFSKAGDDTDADTWLLPVVLKAFSVALWLRGESGGITRRQAESSSLKACGFAAPAAGGR